MRTFTSLPNANYEYALPTVHNYGCAVTGIKDLDGETYPVSLQINSWKEPNVSIGESAVQLSGTGLINSLVSGKTYILLCYDDYKNVPERNFSDSDYSSIMSFVASEETYSFAFNFMSDGVTIFRCVESDIKTLFSPVNFSGHKEVNRSLSQLENIVVLTWSSNSENESVTKYRIYLVESNLMRDTGISNPKGKLIKSIVQYRNGKKREKTQTLLAELDANSFVYWHRNVDYSSPITYCISALDAEGNESELVYTVVK